MSQCVYVGVCVAVNSPACYIWIVNDITYCKTCFTFQVFLNYSVSG